MTAPVAWALLVASTALATAAAEGKQAPPLEVGDRAPAFRLKGTDGKTYSLRQFRGKSAVVLAWYPKAMTGG